MKPLLPGDEAFETILASLTLDIDCVNQENLPVVDNSLTSGFNGALIKVLILYQCCIYILFRQDHGRKWSPLELKKGLELAF